MNASLVHVCRYSGVLDASLAEHQRALRLDPNIWTTVMNTHFVMGNFQLVVDERADEVGYVETMALDAMGRRDEARTRLQPAENRELPPLIRKVVDMLKLLLDGERQRAVESLHELNLEGADPEGYFYRAPLGAAQRIGCGTRHAGTSRSEGVLVRPGASWRRVPNRRSQARRISPD